MGYMLNDNLEQQLRVLYDYWFTQFDFPDENGRPYRSSGGKMVWNDTIKRNIPNSWKVQSVISNFLSSVIKPGVDMFDTKTYLATADVKGTSISTGTIIDYGSRESRANMQPSVNSVWFAKMKNSIKHLYLNEEMQPIISSSILSTGFCGLQCEENSFEYIASYIANPYFEVHKDMLAHGATQEAVNNDDLAGVHILIPDANILQAYHEITQHIYSQSSKNICENQELVKVRDWLLPMLMNGQATISD
jgi:type I restriction enzyme S subunit